MLKSNKLSSKVASFKKIRSTYPYVVRTAMAVTIVGLLVSTYKVDLNAASFNANLNLTETSAPVLDDVTEREVSVLVAQLADIVETEKVQAVTESDLELSFKPQTTIVAKNQVIATSDISRADVESHKVAEGESLSDIAKKYDVTTDTIKWANDLNTEVLSAGQELVILPVDGVLHKVVDGDTPQKLADTYTADANDLVAFNDLEISGLVTGNSVIVPGGTKPAPVTTNRLYSAYVARATETVQYNTGYSGSSSYTYLTHYTGYGSTSTYSRGWCTDWAAYRAGQLGNKVGNQWGNANTWDSSAAAAGYYVGGTPKVGAVFQSDRGGLGHVGVVEEVSSDRSMIKYSDMNGLAGWGNAARTNDWVPASYYEYIYR